MRETMKEEEKKYAYWLCNLPGIGNKTIEKLLKYCGGSAKGVYQAGEECWQQVLNARQLESVKQTMTQWKIEENYEKLRAQEIFFLTKEENAYPQRLRDIPDAPYGIFYKGKLPEQDKMSVAIVGARDCSPYGSYVAAELGKYLGGRGVQIISGMARGIDGISQEAALAAGGTSFGVPGCGVDICYPAQNKKLYERLIAEGGILSIFSPGVLPKAQHFPLRNRIVSGLADAVVVIEARQKSGTLITVDMALEQGREVYVVPGRITDRLSDGCNSLIKQGAGVLLSPQQFLEEITALWEKKKGIWRRENPAGEEKYGQDKRGEEECRKEECGEEKCGEKKRGKEKYRGDKQEAVKQKENYPKESIPDIQPELLRIYEALDFYPQASEQIAEKLSDIYNPVQVNTLLLQLVMQGWAEQLSPGYYCRSRRFYE